MKMDRNDYIAARGLLMEHLKCIVKVARANDAKVVKMLATRREQWARVAGDVVRYIINNELPSDAMALLSMADEARKELEAVFGFGTLRGSLEMGTTVSILEVFTRVERLRPLYGQEPAQVPGSVAPVGADVPQDILRLFAGNVKRYNQFMASARGAKPKGIAEAFKEYGTLTPYDEKGIPTTLYKYLAPLPGFQVTGWENFKKAFARVFN